MRKLFLAAATASLVATPALAAPQRYVESVRHGPQRTVVTKKIVTNAPRIQYRQWHKGQRFDRHQARNYRVIGNPRAHRLYTAPRGYQWVQSGNDAVLVALASGLIGAVLGGAIR